jgi:hypothetical protein
MFERLFGKIQTDDCRKILVDCVHTIREERIMKDFWGIFTVQVPFDYEEFTKSSEYLKKQKALQLLMAGVEIIVAQQGWSMAPFEAVRTRIIEQNYENVWMWKKPVKSPDKKHTAEVICVHDVKQIDIHIVIKNKEKAIVESKVVVSKLPDEFAYAGHLGKLVWLSANEAALISSNGDEQWCISI